jgi:hypothetical protein
MSCILLQWHSIGSNFAHQAKNEHSPLNEHLFIRNLVDSPNCACGQVESAFHFFISCKKYTDLRNEPMYTINYLVTIDVKLLLKGSDTLSVDQNIDIFIKVQNFILKSKRFTS